MRIATWNIQQGIRLPSVLDTVRDLPPLDVLFLQEASRHAGRPDAEPVAEAAGHSACVQFRAQHLRGAEQANAVTWREGLDGSTARELRLPAPERRALRAAVGPGGRNAVRVEGRLAGRPLVCYSVHLDVLGIRHRLAQLETVLADAEPARDALTIVAGDLNTFGVGGRPGWRSVRALAERHGFTDLTRELRWTHRAGRVRQKLDAVLVRPAPAAHRAWTVDCAASDHVPVLVEMEIA